MRCHRKWCDRGLGGNAGPGGGRSGLGRKPRLGRLLEQSRSKDAGSFSGNALLGSPGELFFWSSRAQSEVDLVVQQGSGLRAFEIKWSPRRFSGRAFREAYSVDVEPMHTDNPFAVDCFNS